MFKKIRRKISNWLYALPFGLKAGDEMIAAPTKDGSEGTGIHQQKVSKSVWADLLEGKLTKEAEALRYTMYRAEEKSNEYKYIGGGLAKKVAKPETLKKFKMGNFDLAYTVNESVELLQENKTDPTTLPTRKAISVTRYNNVSRFNIEKYVNSIYVNLVSEPMTIELRFENDLSSRLMRPFLNHLKSVSQALGSDNENVRQKTLREEDVLNGIEKIEFTTYGCSNNIPNGIHYILNDIKYKEFKESQEFISIIYTVGRYEDGKLLSDKYYSKEEDERYKKKERRENAAALIDVVNASKTSKKKDEDGEISMKRHCTE